MLAAHAEGPDRDVFAFCSVKVAAILRRSLGRLELVAG
ncbi:protein of unknown function (plasmid) [Methylocella tundrae]|uniref:Uncharacterized protein n=1 Tax=Methylocella tundrae TaxID=227605 RepID=A0A4U8Z7D2_METTU|nr:protein of unknown function [Methylocella tundrae]